MSQAASFLQIQSGDSITRENFPAYVLAEIGRTSGTPNRCREADQVLLGFWDRFGPDRALQACKVAFGDQGGFWQGAPITASRFKQSHDSYFAEPLLGGVGDD
jgi:hypothetical protein